MSIFSNTNDRAQLAAVREEQFIESCKDEFVEKPLSITNAGKVRILTAVSILPNLLSAVTAGFFVIYLLSGYTRTVAAILGALLLIVVIAIELGKRLLIVDSAKAHFTRGSLPPVNIAALVLLFAGSMAGSYLGGKALVVATAKPPAKEVNPQIAQVEAQLADVSATVDRLRRTTWKGKVTVDAVRGINKAQGIQSALTERLTLLKAQDDAAHAEVLGKHDSKHLNFGIVLGILAAVADLFLFGLLWTAKKLRFEVAAIHHTTGKAMPTGAGIGFQSHFQQPYSLNATPKEDARRPIGFRRYDNRIDDNRNDPEHEGTLTKIVNENRITEGNRICENCGVAYKYRHSKQRFCCEACRVQAWESRTGKVFSKNRKG